MKNIVIYLYHTAFVETIIKPFGQNIGDVGSDKSTTQNKNSFSLNYTNYLR